MPKNPPRRHPLVANHPDSTIDANNTEHVQEIAVALYSARLESPSGGGKDAVKRMIANDGDNGEKLRDRAISYVPIVRALLSILDVRGFRK